MKVIGHIARRRCIGKNLAFADIHVLEQDDLLLDEQQQQQQEFVDNNSSDVILAANTKDRRPSSPPRVIQLVFRRNSPAWNKDLDETFPNKNSKIPYGAKVAVEICAEDGKTLEAETFWEEGTESVDGTTTSNAKPSSFLVRQWMLLEHPREKALTEAQSSDTDGISCTVYLKSRGDAFLRFNDNTLRCQPKPKPSTTTTKDQQEDETSSTGTAPLATNASSSNNETSEFSHGDNRAKALRANIFASWLVETFGQEYLQQTSGSGGGGGVLDIAGGKGKLSIELAIQGQIPCTIIDPMVRKHGAKLEPRDAKRIRKAQAPHPQLVPKPFNTTDFLQDDSCSRRLLEDAQLCVGLHPDECTEDILDVALQYNKPFAIVPCCIFSGFFPLRTITHPLTGAIRPVRTYEEFIEYLLAKDERLQKTTLPFEGRNVVIYLLPKDCDIPVL